jgi:hypothetical protein
MARRSAPSTFSCLDLAADRNPAHGPPSSAFRQTETGTQRLVVPIHAVNQPSDLSRKRQRRFIIQPGVVRHLPNYPGSGHQKPAIPKGFEYSPCAGAASAIRLRQTPPPTYCNPMRLTALGETGLLQSVLAELRKRRRAPLQSEFLRRSGHLERKI